MADGSFVRSAESERLKEIMKMLAAHPEAHGKPVVAVEKSGRKSHGKQSQSPAELRVHLGKALKEVLGVVQKTDEKKVGSYGHMKPQSSSDSTHGWQPQNSGDGQQRQTYSACDGLQTESSARCHESDRRLRSCPAEPLKERRA